MPSALSVTLAVAALATSASAAFARQRPSFRGRVVVVTGGSRGLGLELARRWVSEGARVVLIARDRLGLERAVADVGRHGGAVEGHVCDVRHAADVERTIDAIAASHGRIDVLVNGAGIIVAGPMRHQSRSDFEEAMAVHLWGTYHAVRAVLPYMRRQRGGRIVNIASIGGKVAVPHLAAYCASKFAQTGLSDVLRAELAPERIAVTTVCPGLMRTGSHVNARFKGRHRAEFALFSMIDANPLVSISVQRAARRIVEACRRRRPSLTLTVAAKALIGMNALAPSLTAAVMARTAQLLPGPTPGGDRAHRGWASGSAMAPSALTWLADREATTHNQRLLP